jgi:carboxyl-terminal processing protease
MIDGKDVRGIDLETAIGLMRGPVGTKVKLSLLREGLAKPLEVSITREEISVPTVEGKLLPNTRTGYIIITQFNEKTPDEMLETLSRLRNQGMRGLILDLRDNPGGELISATRVADNFVPKGPVVFIEYSSGNTEVKEADDYYLRLPLAVLVNEGSASAAEILAGAIKDTKAGVLVGTRTFGKGIVQTVFPLDNGAGLKLTTARYLTPGKHDIHKKGVQPDVVVEDREDLPGDEQLNKALELIEQKLQ